MGRIRCSSYTVGLAAAIILPWLFKSPYHIHLMIMSGIFIVLASGLNLIVGYVGQTSLGHTAFFGIGAYVSGLLGVHFGTSFPLGIVAAGVVTGLLGAVIGHLTLRLRGPYFVIVTIGFAEIIHLICLNWVSLTNGPMGVPGVPAADLWLPFVGSIDLSSRVTFYYVTLLLVTVTTYVVYRMINSRVGRAFLSLRENEPLAESIGVSAYKYGMIAFVTGTALAGVAGSFYAHYVCFISPELFRFYYTVTMIVMVIIGGRGTVWGPILGGIIFTVVPEYLRVAAEYRMPAVGLILVLVIRYMPQGILPILESGISRLAGRVRAWRSSVRIA